LDPDRPAAPRRERRRDPYCIKSFITGYEIYTEEPDRSQMRIDTGADLLEEIHFN
jgi:hypothetical protein